MDFNFYYNHREQCTEFRGKIPELKLTELLYKMSKEDRHRLYVFRDIARESKKPSDWLMFISEVFKVQEDLKKQEEKESILQK